MGFTKKQKQFIEIILLALIILSSIFLWDTFVIYPIKLMVVLLHEISHGFAAIITGGKIIDLDIALDLSGFSKIENGNSFIIASSGYLGSLFWGMILFYSSYKKKFRSIILPILAGIIVVFLINTSKNEYLIFITIGIIILLIIINYLLPSLVTDIILKSLGLVSCIYVLIDIKQDVLESTTSYSDASILAEMTGVHQTIWGIFWLLFSIAGIILLIKFAYQKSSLN